MKIEAIIDPLLILRSNLLNEIVGMKIKPVKIPEIKPPTCAELSIKWIKPTANEEIITSNILTNSLQGLIISFQLWNKSRKRQPRRPIVINSINSNSSISISISIVIVIILLCFF